MTHAPDIEPRRFLGGLFLIVLLAVVLRGVFPTADPPWQAPVGITWHDEGPWVHNARNKALWGAWSTDQWNPMYLSPVFTAFEYAAFESFGVGLWQARSVSAALGVLTIACVAFGVAASANRRAGLVAALLLATNYEWVQWNRVALLEATMVAFLAMSWSAYALASRRSWWGAVAGATAVLAVFAKAAAVFYVAALGIEALTSLAAGLGLWPPGRGADNRRGADRTAIRTALWTLGGIAAAGVAFLALFVLPYWTQFRFYNWQMSVVRKPAYSLGAFVQRASWLPLVNGFFTRLWPVLVMALAGAFGLLARWRTARGAERLLGLWLGLGIVEVVMHDAGNERRLLFLVPVLIVLAALVLARDERLVPAASAEVPRRRALVALPIVLYAAYLVSAALVRVAFVPAVRPSVWAGAALALVSTTLLYASWPHPITWLSRHSWTWRGATLVVAVLVVIDLAQFWQWAAARTYKNVEASRLVGTWLPPGTLVQGKLANGLALENRIRPVFVGREFGNYDDRLSRDDVHYLLTYVDPRLGYEGAVINDILTLCPGWRIVRTFDVAETATGHDRAALVLKAPHCAADASGSAAQPLRK